MPTPLGGMNLRVIQFIFDVGVELAAGSCGFHMTRGAPTRCCVLMGGNHLPAFLRALASGRLDVVFEPISYEGPHGGQSDLGVGGVAKIFRVGFLDLGRQCQTETNWLNEQPEHKPQPNNSPSPVVVKPRF